MNVDLISREALKEAFEELTSKKFCGYRDFEKLIDNAPTIYTDCIHCDSGYAQGYSDGYLKGKEERPTGKWNKCFNKEYFIGWKCSRCEKICNGLFNYCPNCGAKMENTED